MGLALLPVPASAQLAQLGPIDLTGIVPGLGPVEGGTSVSIQGNFQDLAGTIDTVAEAESLFTVTFGETPASFETTRCGF